MQKKKLRRLRKRTIAQYKRYKHIKHHKFIKKLVSSCTTRRIKSHMYKKKSLHNSQLINKQTKFNFPFLDKKHLYSNTYTNKFNTQLKKVKSLDQTPSIYRSTFHVGHLDKHSRGTFIPPMYQHDHHGTYSPKQHGT